MFGSFLKLTTRVKQDFNNDETKSVVIVHVMQHINILLPCRRRYNSIQCTGKCRQNERGIPY